MTSKKQRQRMIDYIHSSLTGSEENIVPCSKSIGGINTDFIKVGEDGIIILVDREYANDEFGKLYNLAKFEKTRVASIFYKDRKIFFRSAAYNEGYKQKYHKSLKNYSSQDISKMIILRPEEIFMQNRNEWLQYYQPESEQLPEGIVTLKFEPLKRDYSHINSDERYKPENTKSTLRFIWTERKDCNGPRKLGEYNNSYYLLGR